MERNDILTAQDAILKGAIRVDANGCANVTSSLNWIKDQLGYLWIDGYTQRSYNSSDDSCDGEIEC